MQHFTPASQVILEFISLALEDHRDERRVRVELDARYNAFVEALRVEQETILGYFDRVFGERENALRQFYDLMERASEDGDNEQLKIAVEGIVGVIRSNPLLGFEEFRNALSDPTKVIDL